MRLQQYYSFMYLIIELQDTSSRNRTEKNYFTLDFNTSFSIINRISRQKINNGIEDPYIINHFDLIDILEHSTQQ